MRLAPVLVLLAVSIAWTQKQPFWAFRAPVKQHPPVIAGISHPIDAFVADKLKSKELALSPTASPRALIRRLHFDLTGLPPAGADYRESYEAAIDRPQRSP